MRWWLTQIHLDTQRLCVFPVDKSVLRAASWVFGVDYARRGSLYLRSLTGSVLGYYSKSQTEDYIWKSMLRRDVPSIQQLSENTCWEV